ncbi:MAG: hypothetical protein FWD74_08260 [Actinomycetia bacterium]|nr:hypothetical protein [Actinomycetes bacterium]
MGGTDPGLWVEEWLSTPRFGRYLAETAGDRGRALAAYEWNLKVGAALMRDVAHLEVALRNAYDRVMRRRWRGQSHWLLDPISPAVAPLWRTLRGRRTDLNTQNRASVAEAVTRCGAKPGAVIAELSFGFWRRCTDPAYEKTLWVPYLHHAWPKKTSRATLDRGLAMINVARNRASHHEPLFGGRPGRDLVAAHREILHLLDLLLPDLSTHVRATTTLTTVLGERP